MECTICKCGLTGGTDTFGDVASPMCWECWSTLVFDGDGDDGWVFPPGNAWWGDEHCEFGTCYDLKQKRLL